MSDRRHKPLPLAHHHDTHHHDADYRTEGHHHAAEIPLSAMSQSALIRIGAMAVALAFLWIAVAWAVSLP